MLHLVALNKQCLDDKNHTADEHIRQQQPLHLFLEKTNLVQFKHLLLWICIGKQETRHKKEERHMKRIHPFVYPKFPKIHRNIAMPYYNQQGSEYEQDI